MSLNSWIIHLLILIKIRTNAPTESWFEWSEYTMIRSRSMKNELSQL